MGLGSRASGLSFDHTVTGSDLGTLRQRLEEHRRDGLRPGPCLDVSFGSAARNAGEEREKRERRAIREDGIPERQRVHRPFVAVDRVGAEQRRYCP